MYIKTNVEEINETTATEMVNDPDDFPMFHCDFVKKFGCTESDFEEIDYPITKL